MSNIRKLQRGEVVVVGIDAALSNMGLVMCIVDAKKQAIVEVIKMELVKTSPQDKKVVRRASDRLRRGRELLRALQQFCYGGTIATAEIPEGSQDAGAAWALGVATGILCACPLPIVEVSPREVKQASVGSPSASKEDMRKWAYERFPNAPWKEHNGKRTLDNEHLADALASIEAAMLTQQFRGYAGVWTAQEILAAPYEEDEVSQAPTPTRRRLRV